MLGSKLLVPLDGSMMASLALNHVKQFLADDGRVYLLSVLDRYRATQTFISDVQPPRTIIEERQSYLKSEVLRLSHNDIKATAAVEVGDPINLIVGKSTYCDLILMTAHGWGDFNPERYGEVLREVLRRTECPVAIIPINRFESVTLHEPVRAPAET